MHEKTSGIPLMPLHLKNIWKQIFALANDIIERKYTPKPSICFAVDKPVKREIFAADFRDRVVHLRTRHQRLFHGNEQIIAFR